MNEQLFRKKSIDRVSSPEQLDAYIRVANPSVWMILAAIVILLVGVCVWGVLGHLDTVLTAAAVSENGAVTVYVREGEISSVTEGMTVRIGEEEWQITDISTAPVAVDEGFSEYTLHVGQLQVGEWVYTAGVDAQLPDGIYSAQIVVESVSPVSFVLN